MQFTENDSVGVAGGIFTYTCLNLNAAAAWNGEPAQIWVDNGASEPAYEQLGGLSHNIPEENGDRETWMIMTADRVAVIDVYSRHNSGNDCRWAYVLSEFER